MLLLLVLNHLEWSQGGLLLVRLLPLLYVVFCEGAGDLWYHGLLQRRHVSEGLLPGWLLRLLILHPDHI